MAEKDFEADQTATTTTTTTTTTVEHKKSALSSAPDFSFVRTISGILLLVNLVLLFLAWVCMGAWRDEFSVVWEGRVGFFLFSTVTPFLILIVVIILYILALPKKITAINWPITMVINCLFWAFLLIIASSLIAYKVDECKDVENIIKQFSIVVKADVKCGTFAAAAAFGFLSMFGLIAEAVMHFREFRAN